FRFLIARRERQPLAVRMEAESTVAITGGIELLGSVPVDRYAPQFRAFARDQRSPPFELGEAFESNRSRLAARRRHENDPAAGADRQQLAIRRRRQMPELLASI